MQKPDKLTEDAARGMYEAVMFAPHTDKFGFIHTPLRPSSINEPQPDATAQDLDRLASLALLTPLAERPDGNPNPPLTRSQLQDLLNARHDQNQRILRHIEETLAALGRLGSYQSDQERPQVVGMVALQQAYDGYERRASKRRELADELITRAGMPTIPPVVAPSPTTLRTLYLPSAEFALQGWLNKSIKAGSF